MRRRLGLVAEIWGLGGGISLTILTVLSTLTSSAIIVIIAETPQVKSLGPSATTLLVGGALCFSYFVIILVAWAGSRASDCTLAEGVGLRRVTIGVALGVGGGVALAARIFAGVYGILVQQAGFEVDTRSIDPTQLLPDTPTGIVLTALIVVVLAPLAEEIVFRGVLMTAISDRWGLFWGITVSSAVFASMHVVVVTMLPIFVLAVALSLVFVRTKSLWPPVIAHSVFNAVGLAAAYALGNGAGL